MMPQITAQAICLILALAALLVAVLCGYGTSTSYISGEILSLAVSMQVGGPP